MMMNKAWKPYLVPATLGVLLMTLYFIGNARAIRYCNCKTTEDWKPGEQKNKSHGSVRSHYFYHK